MAREQKIEARILAEMQGVKAHTQGELPPGVSSETLRVNVPCPFKVEIVCCNVEVEEAPEAPMSYSPQ
eukprot:753633-Hanusia_phi.AAC.1